MTLFPFGVTLALCGFTAGLFLWQRIVYWSFGLLGFLRTPPPDSMNIRRRGFHLLVWGGGTWFLILAGSTITVARRSSTITAGAYLLGGAALVPILIVPNAMKVLRRLDRKRVEPPAP